MDQYVPYILLATAAPFGIWATLSDLKSMKIYNVCVLAMAAAFFVVGIFVLPFDEYLWRILGGFIILAIGFTLFSLGVMGGGDAKFAASMALFVPYQDGLTFLFILSVFTITAVVIHKIVGKLSFASPITSTWESWSAGKKFPLGFGMGGALIIYLVLVALGKI